MEITFSELRRDPAKILKALEHKESLTLSRRGKIIAHIVPVERKEACKPSEHEAFGMWADREDMKDPVAYIRKMRQGRFHELWHGSPDPDLEK